MWLFIWLTGLFVWFLTVKLAFFLPVICCACEKTDFSWNSKIPKTIKENATFIELMKRVFSKLSNNTQTDILWRCGSLVIDR